MTDSHTESGSLVISLDFELYWGIRQKQAISDCADSLLGARNVVPELLKLFQSHQIHATWATVGFLFFESTNQALGYLPEKEPNYLKESLCNCTYLKSMEGEQTSFDFHFAPELIEQIRQTPGQEIASHTFSHYFCLEERQDSHAFRCDLEAMNGVASKWNVDIKSIVFPRNQVNRRFLKVCKQQGIESYRGLEKHKVGRSIDDPHARWSSIRRLFRLLNAYVNLSGDNSYALDEIRRDDPYPVSIPSSRFLRPYSKCLRRLEPLRLKRLTSEMTLAAKKKHIYHLWWHPHNFGKNTDENLSVLKALLDHYEILKRDYGLESHNMAEVFQKVSLRSST